jgi:3-oxoacyl-[acyl-carrier-protein] synthase-3
MTEVGMVGYGLYFPAEFETAAEIASRAGLTLDQVATLGVRRKHRPSPEDQPVAMAVKAALRAFQQAEDISPDDVDVVVYTGEEYKDYIAQTAAIRIQEEVGCRRAFAFDLVEQGVSTVMGLRIARDMMIGDPDVRTVLLAGGTRNTDLVDYRRPDTRFLLPYSASGAAVLLRRDHGRNRLTGLAFHVDPEMADDVFVPGGGTEHPFREDNLASEIMFYRTNRPEKVAEYLRENWPKRLVETARQAAQGARPDYLALRHTAPADRKFILNSLGLSTAQSAELGDFGHHGSNDVIVSLDLGLASGAVRPGSTVVMATGGIGFTYAAAAFIWG